jgi:hypothetical protein
VSADPPPQPRPPRPGRAGRSPWLTRRAISGHVALAIWVPGCVVATYWQVGIALSGDDLGWVYSVMWPCFAIFGTIFWWYLVHDDPETLGARGQRRAAAESTGAPGLSGAGAARTEPASPDAETDADRLARAEEDDPELAAYNAYLADLAHQGKSWRRR